MCIHKTPDGLCRKYSDDTCTSYCVEGPCPHDTPSTADHIRAMSDEELIQFQAALIKTSGCPPSNPEVCIDDCKKCWGIYLRQPLEEET